VRVFIKENYGLFIKENLRPFFLTERNFLVVFSEGEKNRRWQEIRMRQHRLKATGQVTNAMRQNNNFEQSMQKAGFSMNDIKGRCKEIFNNSEDF
jgi:hypothetical protein